MLTKVSLRAVSRSGLRSHREEPQQWWGGCLGRGGTLSPLPHCWEEGQCSGLFLPCLASTPGPLEPRQQPRSELGRGHLSPRSQQPGCTVCSADQQARSSGAWDKARHQPNTPMHSVTVHSPKGFG